MNNLNLIPFGLHVPSALLTDVGSVEKGVQCDCICPSCKTPLIARQGEIKEWHFAHQSRSTEQETEAPCEYSLAVSLRLMIKQLFEEGAVFYLPEYKKTFTVPIPGCFKPYQKTVTISQEAKVQFDNVAIEYRKEEVLFDLVLTKGKHKLFVYITYKGRPFPEKLIHHEQQDAIIEFNVFALLNAFSEAKMGQYKKILAMFLASSAEGKKWRSHPRENKCFKQLSRYIEENKDAILDHYDEKPNKMVFNTPSSTKIKTQAGLKATAHNFEERKRALHGAFTDLYVLLGSSDASLSNHASKRENVMGRYDAFNEQMLHLCTLCGSEWQGQSNQCSMCQTHKKTRSVFNHNPI